MSEEPTIRTKASRVMQDETAPAPLKELALEVLHWRLRDRFARLDADATAKIGPTA
jgi:hypothetical protein